MFIFDSRIAEVSCSDVEFVNSWLIKVLILSLKLEVVFVIYEIMATSWRVVEYLNEIGSVRGRGGQWIEYLLGKTGRIV